MLYGTSELPEIITQPEGRPVFATRTSPFFHLLHGQYYWRRADHRRRLRAGYGTSARNRSFTAVNAHEDYPLSSNEKLWIRNQNDPEASAQLITLRQSIRKLCGCASDDASLLQLFPAPDVCAPQAALVEALSDAEDVLVWSIAATPPSNAENLGI
jgi:phosphopantetheinyl transferase